MSKEKVIIDLCSSDEEEEVEQDLSHEELDETEEDDESSLSDDDDDDSDWSDDDDTDYSPDVRDDESGTKGNDDDDKVTRLLTAGSDLKSLNVKECKAYLRQHGLRLTGTKAVFIDRIIEHWRIKDGSGESLYPTSSFVINCKGDVCKGDTVLFTQKMKGTRKIIGRRTVAGQVVKESYGAAKQQHTFTIEVLWCVGIQKLPPLYPLLVKGRNLYRLMTLRQRWANEEDRVKVLSEKHSRGAAARKVMRERKIKSGYVLKDGRLQKPGHVKKKPCQVKTRKNEKDENQTQRFRQAIPANHSRLAFPNQKGHMNPNMNLPSHIYAPRPHGPPPPRAPRPYAPFNVYHSHLPRPSIPPSHSYAYPTQQHQSFQRPPPALYNGRPTSNALQGQASFHPHVTHQRRAYENHHTLHAGSNRGYNYGVRELDHFSEMMISHRQSEDTRRPYKNHQTYHSNSSNAYNHGASRMTSHRRGGGTQAE